MAKKKAKCMGDRSKSEPGDYIVQLLIQGDDRASVLLGCGFIEHCLEKLLRKHFSLYGNGNPEHAKLVNIVFDGSKENDALLQSNWSMSVLACILGLIPHNCYRACSSIRRMRNTCAHYPGSVKFDPQAIDQLLILLGKDAIESFEYWENITEDGQTYFWGERHKAGEFTLARRKFMHACLEVTLQIRRKTQEIDPDLPDNHSGLILG